MCALKRRRAGLMFRFSFPSATTHPPSVTIFFSAVQKLSKAGSEKTKQVRTVRTNWKLNTSQGPSPLLHATRATFYLPATRGAPASAPLQEGRAVSLSQCSGEAAGGKLDVCRTSLHNRRCLLLTCTARLASVGSTVSRAPLARARLAYVLTGPLQALERGRSRRGEPITP